MPSGIDSDFVRLLWDCTRCVSDTAEGFFIWRPPFGFAQGLELVERLTAE
jgi:hypothetical protein